MPDFNIDRATVEQVNAQVLAIRFIGMFLVAESQRQMAMLSHPSPGKPQEVKRMGIQTAELLDDLLVTMDANGLLPFFDQAYFVCRARERADEFFPCELDDGVG